MASTMIEAYRRMQVHTASPATLVFMLLQGALRFVKMAEEALHRDDMEAAHHNLVRAQNIIGELMGSLDLDKGEVAGNLFKIYDYMIGRLVDANVRKRPEPVAEVAVLLEGLLPAWQEVARKAS